MTKLRILAMWALTSTGCLLSFPDKCTQDSDCHLGVATCNLATGQCVALGTTIASSTAASSSTTASVSAASSGSSGTHSSGSSGSTANGSSTGATSSANSGPSGSAGSSGVSSSTSSSGSASSASSSSSSSSGTLGCLPGALRCADAAGGITPQTETCATTGDWTDAGACPSGYCALGDAGAFCGTACQAAETTGSYLGCDYWGVLLSNSGLDPAFTGDSRNQQPGTTESDFAFVVSNSDPNVTASVQIAPGNQTVSAFRVPPLTTETVYLPWLPICGSGTANFGYHLTSDAPVTAYQFNPLHSYVTLVDGGLTYGYSNDASLLVPTHALGTQYAVASVSHLTVGAAGNATDDGLAANFAIVATQNQTRISITFAGASAATGTSQTVAGDACGTLQGNLPAHAVGAVVPFELSAGQVVQFWSAPVGSPTCSTNPSGNIACQYPSDFTGTLVSSVGPDGGVSSSAPPVAVFGGADCTYVPYNQLACDHIEEEMLPVSTWGRQYVGVKSAAYTGATSAYPDFFRLISACTLSSCPDGARVTFTPALPDGITDSIPNTTWCLTANGTTTCVLPAISGAEPAPWIGFQSGDSFAVSSDQPISVAQYLVSATESGQSTNTGLLEGDPDLLMLPPVEQWRTQYAFLAPASFVNNYVDLVVRQDSTQPNATGEVFVDGRSVFSTEWNNIPNTPFWAANHPVCGSADTGCNGTHTLSSSVPVGISVSGYDNGTSYSFAGGLNFASLVATPTGHCASDQQCVAENGSDPSWYCDSTGTCQQGCLPDDLCETPLERCCELAITTCSPVNRTCVPLATASTGTTGTAGTTGTSGTAGTIGSTGTAGTIGITGTTGANGTSGNVGTTGS